MILVIIQQVYCNWSFEYLSTLMHLKPLHITTNSVNYFYSTGTILLGFRLANIIDNVLCLKPQANGLEGPN
jgi:hypothetical protein